MSGTAGADLNPLACPACGAPVALADAPSAPCPRCAAEVAIPAAHRAAFVAEELEATTRTATQALCAELGAPPGALSRALGASFDGWWFVLGGFFGTTLLSLVGVVVVLRAVTALYDDNVDETLSRATTDALRIPLTAVAMIVGAGIGLYARRRALSRRRLIVALAAKPALRAGGPPACRVCGAALAVAPAALGVRCVYCGGDNLVALPPAWVEAAGADEVAVHMHVDAANAELVRVGARVKRALSLQVGGLTLVVAATYVVTAARAAARPGAELRVPPSWPAFAVDPRPLARRDPDGAALAKDVTRMDFEARCAPGDVPLALHPGDCAAGGCSLRLYAALREGERATITFTGLARRGHLTVSRHEGLAWPNGPLEPFGPRVADLTVAPGAPATFVAPWSAWHEPALTMPEAAWSKRASVCFRAAR